MLPEDKSAHRGYNFKDHPRHLSLKLKLEALHRCFEPGEDVQSERPRGDLTEGAPASTKELEQLKEQIQDMQMEIAILEETINVLKKT